MLHLKNIKISQVKAEADYSPESSGWWGHIVVNLKNEEIITYDKHPEYAFMYPGHALRKLVRMARDGDTGTECTVMWY